MSDDRDGRIHHLRPLPDVRLVLRESDRVRYLRLADAGIDRPNRASRDTHSGAVAAISRAVAGLLRAHTGTRPTAVNTEMSSALAIVTLGERRAEARALGDGEGQSAAERQLRTAVYQGMRAEAVAAVEGITDRQVVAYLTDHQHEPELAVMVFVFGPWPQGRS